VNTFEKPLVWDSVAFGHAVPQGSKRWLETFGSPSLHASAGRRQKDASCTAVGGMRLAAHETPLLQQPEDGRNGVCVRRSPRHDSYLHDAWFARDDPKNYELVGRDAFA